MYPPVDLNRIPKSNSRKSRGRRAGRRPTQLSRMSIPQALRVTERRVFPIVQSINWNVPFVASTGMNFGGTSGFEVCLAVDQAALLWSAANSGWSVANTNFYNYSSLATVFQEYRILRFDVDVYYSVNSGPSNSTNTGGALPILYAVQDREDARSLGNVPAFLQYATCKIMQLGTSNGSSHGRQSISMSHPSCYVVNEDASSLSGATIGSQLARSPWLSCGTSVSGASAARIPHGYIKFFIDPEGCTNTTANGTITFIARMFAEYRGID